MVLPLKNWSFKQDRPREKLSRDQEAEMTDVELVAAILGTGSKNEHVLKLAKKLLESVDNSLTRLTRRPIAELKRFTGVGSAKASRFKAAVELARRMQFDALPKDFKVVTSKDAFRVLGLHLGAEMYVEEFWAVYLNRRSKILDKARISIGGMTSTIADPRVIFGRALDLKASSVIVAHNHPSGSLKPSQADITLTKKLVEGGKILDIQLVDHLIISGDNYCSFADSGLL
jgi:DNA repair protein RadC